MSITKILLSSAFVSLLGVHLCVSPVAYADDPRDRVVHTGTGTAGVVGHTNCTATANVVAHATGTFTFRSAGQTVLFFLNKDSRELQVSPPLSRSPLRAGESITYEVLGPDDPNLCQR